MGQRVICISEVNFSEGAVGKPSLKSYRPIANYEYHTVVSRGHTVGANVHCEEGNNPDRQLRSQSSD